MTVKLQGHAVKYGDNISTDLIIAGKHTKTLNVRTSRTCDGRSRPSSVRRSAEEAFLWPVRILVRFFERTGPVA
jgi:hypothetical protein